MIEPIKKVMVHSKAAEAIRKYIKENGLKDGDKLPSERQMAAMLCIGRNSLREALRTLETINLIEVINGRGVFVKDINALNSINIHITSAKVDFLELLDIRKMLETYAIELAVKNADEIALKEIEKILIQIEKKYELNIYPFDEDTQFHHAIYRASNNQTLYDLIKPLAATFDELWEPFGQREKELMMETIPLHRPLFEAIRNRKLGEAKRILRRIIDMGEKAIVNYRVTISKNGNRTPSSTS